VKVSKAFFRLGLAGILAASIPLSFMVSFMATDLAKAATEQVPLERLHIHDVILLPTVSSQYEAQFTRPKTWQVSPKTALYLEFQHSSELLPNRSWLQIIVNDKVIKHIPLTKDNIEGSKLTIPIPVALLKDFNKLNFRVEQHYTDKCEDPLDKSLWTQILPATRLVFDYSPTVPQVALNAYPYPIIDTLTYSPAKVHYVVPQTATAQELEAMAYVNVHLAQQAQDHELHTRATFGNSTGPDDEHLVFVGKGGSLPNISGFSGQFGKYSLQGGQWMDTTTNQPLAKDQGLVLFFQAPGSQQHTVLIVTGNSEEGVLKAAQALTQRPLETSLTGNAYLVQSSWSPAGNRSATVPRFVEEQGRTFHELGFKNEEVHKINAPPITYKVPVVTQFANNGGKLNLELNYSYSPQLNPEFSSLELRMNDVSIANIPLLNPSGEQMQHASIPISPELIKPRNNLVAQFHLMPDKYGWCVDNYVDNAWGKIMDDSRFTVEGSPKSYLPDVGLLNNTMYPYSQTDNLETVQLVVPEAPSEALLDALLGFTTRLGRATLADTDLRLDLIKGSSGIDANKHAAVFRSAKDNISLPAGAKLVWQTDGATMAKELKLQDPDNGQVSAKLAELGSGAYMEQYVTGGNHIVSVITAPNSDGFLTINHLFEDDKTFEPLASGLLQHASSNSPQLNPITPIRYHQEKQLTLWEQVTHWVKALPWTNIIIGLVAGFFLLILLPFIVGRILRK
jgi:hypothetical protein